MSTDVRALSPSERIDWLRLIRSENVGPVTFRKLLERFGSASAALAALPELARKGGRLKPIAIASRAAAERELKEADRLGVAVLGLTEPAYPALLRSIDDAPPLLFVRGSAHLLARPSIAIVGARNASLNGRKMARDLAAELAKAGHLVVSGMARGIDTAAHEGALSGGTAAVLAGGVDVIYPPENDKLYAALVDRGVVVSEMPPGMTPQASHFPRRNRIISGLSLGVVVVEATPRSGSLITARLAGEQGREVFAVPGSPMDPRSGGPNHLIRDGATLIESADDVLRGLSDLLRRPLGERRRDTFGGAPAEPPGEPDLERARRLVEETLGVAPVQLDEVIRATGLSAAVVALVLLELDLAGRLDRLPGQRLALVG
jgi:DNA processing protein